MAKVRHPVDPKPHRPKLENTPFRFFLDQRQTERIAVKRDRLLITVAWTFNRDIRAALGLTQTVLAGTLGVTRRAVGDWEA